MKSQVIAITGAGGFVGSHLCKTLMHGGWPVRALVRQNNTTLHADEIHTGLNLTAETHWQAALQGTHTLIHCAGLAHGNRPEGYSSESHAFTAINSDATYALANAALKAGVKRFIFMSSIAVYGKPANADPVSEGHSLEPATYYGQSKLSAEKRLSELFHNTDVELVILRPPLIYGPNCPGNFSKLVKLVKTGIPLPFARITGKRHFLAIANLSSLVEHICNGDGNTSGIYNVADQDVIDLQIILDAISQGLSKTSTRFPFPVPILFALARLANKAAELEKLTGSFQIDNALVKAKFNWNPPQSSLSGMQEAAASFRDK